MGGQLSRQQPLLCNWDYPQGHPGGGASSHSSQPPQPLSTFRRASWDPSFASPLARPISRHYFQYENFTALQDNDQEEVREILEYIKDAWKSPMPFSLVEEYFDCCLHTLHFCTVLKKCLKRAWDSQIFLHVSLQRFDEEDQEEGEGEGEEQGAGNRRRNRYARILEELRHFRDAGGPFTEEFHRVQI